LSTTIKLDYDSAGRGGRCEGGASSKGVEGSFDFVRGSHGHQIPDWLANHHNQMRCIVEGKSEMVMNAHYENLLERADNDTEIVWAETSVGANTANLLYKVQRLLSWLVSVC